MSLFGPVTDTDLRIWQLAATTLLQEMLDRTHRRELPPIAWRISILGSLTGTCRTTDEWAAWSDTLDLADVRPPFPHGNRTRYHADGSLTTTRGQRVSVALLADVDTERPRDETPDRPRRIGDHPTDAA